MSNCEYVKLNNGHAMPTLGLGTFKMKNDMELEEALDCAIMNGYRLIDTAEVYQNEHIIGRCLPMILRKHNLERHDIFVTTKLGPKSMDPTKVRAALENSLKKLGMNYVDLYLIHWPAKQGLKSDDSRHATLRRQCWEVLEDVYTNTGMLKALGVSNYTCRHMDELLAHCAVKPAVLQSELHPDHLQEDLLALCRSNAIHFQAYSSLGSGMLVCDERFSSVAAKYGKSVAQVLLRWAIDKNCSVIPKSTNKDHIKCNSQIFDFSLTTTDVKAIEGVTAKEKYCWDPRKVA